MAAASSPEEKGEVRWAETQPRKIPLYTNFGCMKTC